MPHKQLAIKVSHLFNQIGINECKHYERIVRMGSELCYLSATKTIKERKVKFVILVSFNKPDYALSYYKERWQIETLFKAMKSSGFNIEDTHVTARDRLQKLILLTMMAFAWCCRVGDYLDQQIKPIIIKNMQEEPILYLNMG